MNFFFLFIYFFFILFNNLFSQETECQGAILRVLNKTTNEKNFFTVPLSRTIELDNANLVVHRCLKLEKEGKNDEVALLSHKFKKKSDNDFIGWIFNSSQYINSPRNPVYDIKLEKCLIDDPIFLKNN